MSRTKIFMSNRLQAVRLAKDVAFSDSVKEVTVLRDGDRRVIAPADRRWDDFFESPGIDLGERDQPEAQIREAL
jgi:antitoxin VapB